MADVKMPKSIPCKFDKAWQGECKKPSTNGWCSEHESLTCKSCGKKAVKSCDHTGSLVCGESLCETCEHGKDYTHITREAANKIRTTERNKEIAKKQSRTSAVQRMNEELGVPLNLFEFLKGDRKGSEIKELFLLELEHGLMGYFPAIFCGTERTVITTDVELIGRVWRIMEPCESKISKGIGHVIFDKNLVYPILGDDQYSLERSVPLQLLTEIEFSQLTMSSFEWAPGLLSFKRGPSPEQFEEIVQRGVAKYQVVGVVGTNIG